ncbi:MAG: FAD-dependent oxidoreductase, partial [Lentisphaeria bacterium]|nr:FAD-dependent oxidoreductase [Lentisphaeria bacterium]
RDAFRASKIMVERAKSNPKIKFHLNSNVTEIVGGEEVEGVIIRNSVTGEESRIDCKAYFAALGHVPSTALFKGVLEMNEAGYLTLQGQSSRTSMEGVFAAGDCADPAYRQAIHAAGMGCAAAIDAERWLNG